MKINKYKKVGKNKYKVYFDNNEIILFEDVILKYDLLFLKDVSLELLDKIINENKFYEAYDMSLSYIETKMRNKKYIFMSALAVMALSATAQGFDHTPTLNINNN